MHTLARYGLVRPLGAGAMGGVYLVEDRLLGGPPVALKRLAREGDPALRDSLAREFAVLASLALDGVARVHDLGVMPAHGELPEGPFFTRDFVDGVPLGAWATGRDVDALLGALHQVLGTVATLHARAVVHGDLKPANVIVDAHDRPHLIDFGAASARGHDALHGSGTPLFMAPEILRGGPSSMCGDVYALGALIWVVLTGAAPLAELGPRALGAKLRGELPRVDARASPRVRAALEAALWALAADPAARAPSADAVAARLERATGLAPRARTRSAAIAPRPRGRDALLAMLARRARGEEGGHAGITLLHGARGLGKSTVLRELKWRLQLAGAPVIELRCRAEALAPVAQLARQLGAGDARTMEGAAQLDATARRVRVAELSDALVRGDRPHVVLVDDLDVGGGLLAEVLREATCRRPDVGHAPLVIATSEALSAPGLAAFVDLDAVAVVPLDAATVRAIVAEAVGPLDESAIEALSAHADGNPGVLVEALAWLGARGDLTARDLAERGAGAIGASLAEARVAGLDASARDALTLLAYARGPLDEALVRTLYGDDAVAASSACGLARIEAGSMYASDSLVADWLRGARVADGRVLVARALRDPRCASQSPVVCAELALIAEDEAAVRAWIEPALAALSARGEPANALRLFEAAAALGVREPALLLAATELRSELGDCARAAALGEQLLAAPQLPSSLLGRARLATARAHVAGADFERATQLLRDVPADAPRGLRADALRELARVYRRRGDFAGLEGAVTAGLAVATSDDAALAELLALDAHHASRAGDHGRAEARYEAALAAARGLGLSRDEAIVLGYRAFSSEGRGALEDAQRDYQAALAAARRAGDLGLTATYALNVGTVGFRLGRLGEVEPHYTLAARLARRAGRVVTALTAENNLAHLTAYLGNFERARGLAEATLAEAERNGIEIGVAFALAILADVDARSGQHESALARFEASASRYDKIGRVHEAAEAWLDAAETLLDRGGVSDASAASSRLAHARTYIERHAQDDLRPRLRLLIARVRADSGDVAGAAAELAELAKQVGERGDRETLWQVLGAAADVGAMRGAGQQAAEDGERAAQIVVALCENVPPEAREAFRADPRRRRVLARANERRAARPAVGEAAALDARVARLLEIIKRLARERDLDRLLERITDAAVDLSGAERGFVLLVDAKGQLEPHLVRASGGAESDPHVAFSRSIAEAVLIDGEPIVTVNARDDARLNEYVSVHRLLLKSVACIPISGPRGVVGVLYLEHRLRAGRFREDDIDLLLAFADQAAIALENARLWSENERRQRELEAQARELSAAKDEIERVLEARTEELAQTRRDLGRARAALESTGMRHGIVGQGPAMQRVFALIERVADSPVPVIIEGESGTGKELVARAIHASGARRKEPFVAINCAALPEQLLESELFGHVRGAFTGADRDKRGLFAQAQGGTIFLDEFADMPARMQVDLLRVLQERRMRPVGAEADVPIDVRVVAASNRPLKQLVETGRLREDLYYRMSVVELRLPPLRERREDIPLLCDHFLARIVTREGARPLKLSRAAVAQIATHELPGNVRQLEHLLTSAAMLADGAQIEPGDLSLVEPRSDSSIPPAPMPADAAATPTDLEGFKDREKQRILAALEQHGWNRAKAATALGMPRRTFYRRLGEFNIL